MIVLMRAMRSMAILDHGQDRMGKGCKKPDGGLLDVFGHLAKASHISVHANNLFLLSFFLFFFRNGIRLYLDKFLEQALCVNPYYLGRSAQ